MGDLYPPLDLPVLQPGVLKKGLRVQTRSFYGNSLPGSQAKVLRFWETPRCVYVRCSYGKNQSGQSLLKTMPINVLALSQVE